MKYRMINTRFWADSFVDELSPTEKLLFLYLLTNDKTNICGIYELPIRVMSNETQIPKDKIVMILKSLEPKVTYFDGWVCVHNFIKHQQNNEKVKIGIERARKQVPDRILKHIHSLSKPIHSLSKGLINLNSNLNSNSNLKINKSKDLAKAGNNDINEMFDYWLQTTGLPISSRVKQNRYACGNLLKRHGIDGLKRLVYGVAQAQSDQYAPRIANFIQLQSKTDELILWGKKKSNRRTVQL